MAEKVSAKQKAEKIASLKTRDGLMALLGKINVTQKPQVPLSYISTGSIAMDRVLEGGWARGRSYELYGLPGSGKSTMGIFGMLQASYMALKEKKRVFYFDMEKKTTVEQMVKMGLPFAMNEYTGEYQCTLVGFDNQPIIEIWTAPNGESAMEAIKLLLQSKQYVYGVIDSIAKCIPSSILESELNDFNVGTYSRIMTKFTHQVNEPLETSGCALICLNQIRDNMENAYVKNTPGGKGFKHLSAAQLEFMKPEYEFYDSEDKTQMMTFKPRFRIRKTNVFDFNDATHEVCISRDKDTSALFIDPALELYTIAKVMKLFTNTDGKVFSAGNAYFDAIKWGYNKPRATNKINHVVIANGAGACVAALREDPELFISLKKMVYAKFSNASTSNSTEQENEVESPDPDPQD